MTRRRNHREAVPAPGDRPGRSAEAQLTAPPYGDRCESPACDCLPHHDAEPSAGLPACGGYHHAGPAGRHGRAHRRRQRQTLWPVLLLLSLGLAAILWPSAPQPAWLTPQLRTAVPAGVSLALTAVGTNTEPIRKFGPGEVAVLLCLLMITVRTGPPRWAALCA